MLPIKTKFQPVALQPELVQYAMRTMREQSMFILPRFYLGPEMNNYDLWKLAAWLDKTNEATRKLRDSIKDQSYWRHLNQYQQLRELTWVSGGGRHSNREWLNTNYLDAVSIRTHQCVIGTGTITNVATGASVDFAPGDVLVFQPGTHGQTYKLWFSTDSIAHVVGVWAPASAKKNWELFAEASMATTQEAKISFNI